MANLSPLALDWESWLLFVARAFHGRWWFEFDLRCHLSAAGLSISLLCRRISECLTHSQTKSHSTLVSWSRFEFALTNPTPPCHLWTFDFLIWWFQGLLSLIGMQSLFCGDCCCCFVRGAAGGPSSARCHLARRPAPSDIGSWELATVHPIWLLHCRFCLVKVFVWFLILNFLRNCAVPGSPWCSAGVCRPTGFAWLAWLSSITN